MIAIKQQLNQHVQRPNTVDLVRTIAMPTTFNQDPNYNLFNLPMPSSEVMKLCDVLIELCIACLVLRSG
jgi:hypothetical protein